MKILTDFLIALAGIVLTIIFEIGTVLADPVRFEELKKDQTKLLEFLAVPFDLWLVSFSLLVGAAIGTKKKNLTWPMGVAAICLVITLCSLVLSVVVPKYHNLFHIYVPDILGLIFIAYAAHSLTETA